MKICIIEPKNYSPEALAEYAKLGNTILIDTSPIDLLTEHPDVTVIVTRLKHHLGPDFFNAATQLRYVVTPTTGESHIDCAAAQANEIKVLSLKNEKAFLAKITPTAEHTWGLLLAISRQIHVAHQDVTAGNWERDSFPGPMLSGKTLGIIGYGRLGKIVANYGSAFGMNVLAFDTSPEPLIGKTSRASLHKLLHDSHFITLHLPSTDDTHGFISAREFSQMQRRPFLINTSRGEVLDELDLLRALKDNVIAGAALDVLANETRLGTSLTTHPLIQYARTHSNLLVTPHIAGAAPEAMRKTEVFMAKKLQRHVLK